MIKSTLFIRVDDTPVPNEVKTFCHIVDCRQIINTFLSFVGDALLGELKDETGTPYYRVITPAGKIISEFELDNQVCFQNIIEKWYELFARLIQDTNLPKSIPFLFPIEYTNWLQSHINDYYINVGHELQDRNNIIELSSTELYDEIIINKLLNYISEEMLSQSFGFVVFSNSNVTSEPSFLKKMSLESHKVHFLTFDQLVNWGKLIEERRVKLKNSLTYDRFYSQNKSFIEQQIECAFGNIMTELEYIQGYAFFANFSIWKREKIRSLFEVDSFQQIFFNCEKKLADNISVKVQDFRDENEFNTYFDYEEKMCKSLGIDYIPVSKEIFLDYYFPIEYRSAIRNFVDIIVDFNEENANEDLGVGFVISSVDSLINNKTNHYVERLKRRLQDYYRYYCLGNLKNSLHRIWCVYEPKDENSKNIKRSSGCYITTAMCNYLDKKNDCYELTILRGFRDNWLQYQPNGKDLIQEYYRYAPSIVDKLNHTIDKDVIYGEIKKCIYVCLSYIGRNQFEMAKDTYISMIRYLSKKVQ